VKFSIEKISDYNELFRFYNSEKIKIPYWFDVEYDVWHQSMFEDTDYASASFFDDLNTYVAYSDSGITGFIQFGIPNYIFNQNGAKNINVKAGIIRNLYFSKENTNCGAELVKIAEEYFDNHHIKNKFAFFHAFGMTCNAGHGKLHTSQHHIEAVLYSFGYTIEHENVYYSKILDNYLLNTNSGVEIKYSEMNAKGLFEFVICVGDTNIGAGELVILPQKTIAYLKFIYVKKDFKRKGYASEALGLIFAYLYQKGIRRFDTDTAGGNVIAQRLYEKMGFANLGRTRSYLIEEKQWEGKL